jgi:hypothetical protein
MREQVCEPQVLVSMHSGETAVVEAPLLTQVSRKSQLPNVPQSEVIVQLAGAPLCSSGKYLSATPRPAEPESVKNALSAALTADHLVVPAPVVSFIDNEESIRKYRSSGTGAAPIDDAAQAPSRLASVPMEPPLAELPPVPLELPPWPPLAVEPPLPVPLEPPVPVFPLTPALHPNASAAAYTKESRLYFMGFTRR